MTLTSQRVRNEILELMSDGKVRSTEEISTTLAGKYKSTYGKAIGELRDEKLLEWIKTGDTVSPHLPRMYRLANRRALIGEPDNNPFLWRSFKQPEFS